MCTINSVHLIYEQNEYFTDILYSVPLKGIETTNLLQHIPTKSLAFWGCNDFLTEKWDFSMTTTSCSR